MTDENNQNIANKISKSSTAVNFCMPIEIVDSYTSTLVPNSSSNVSMLQDLSSWKFQVPTDMDKFVLQLWRKNSKDGSMDKAAFQNLLLRENAAKDLAEIENWFMKMEDENRFMVTEDTIYEV